MKVIPCTIFFACLISMIYIKTNAQERNDESEIYSKAFSLPQLILTGSTEIRIWGNEYVFGNIVAIIVKDNEISECRTSIEQTNDGEHRIIPGKCNNKGISIDAKQVQEMADILVKFDKKNIYCKNKMDGWGGIIEGINNGKRFSFGFLNPEACKTPEAIELSRILKSLLVEQH
jgi:hypothetical protein